MCFANGHPRPLCTYAHQLLFPKLPCEPLNSFVGWPSFSPSYLQAGKYVLQCIDARVEGTWQAKGSWSKALDFLTEAMRFALFLMFFGIIFTYYGTCRMTSKKSPL
jgi:hypothetical protein